jgi:UDP-N-acetylmuramoyl-L-alanyl-D-glutamate--2,6-diaminopimelate ligase
MRLKDILKKIPSKEVIGKNLNLKIEHASSDSRLIFDKSIFIAEEGLRFNALDFIGKIQDKATCIITSSRSRARVRFLSKKYPHKVFVLVDDLSQVQEKISKLLFKGASNLNIIGVTGTNGKTTVSFLIHKILSDLKRPCGLVGTVHYAWGKKSFHSTLTTPDNLMLKSILHKAYTDKMKYVALEASSHALAQDRLKGLKFSRAIFTNLSHDHLDFHKNIDNYFKAKFKIFSYLASKGKAVINIDDKYGAMIYKRLKPKALSFAIKHKADYRAKAYRFDKKGLEFLINLKGKSRIIRVPLLGLFNIYNVLAAIAWADSLGLNMDKVLDSLITFKGPQGRLEEVTPGVFVDYAHTPHALEQSLRALRGARFGKIVVVFGCGGDRDRRKRPKMGRIATKLADHSIITLDNPRSEDPKLICKDITKGITSNHYQVILDRRRAIKKALSLKKDSWAVLIAGKGHEDYQIFKDKTIKFSDKETVKELLKI